MTTKLEQEFFEAMGVSPTMLTDCSYKNLQLYRYEYGDDCCEHLDDFDFSCDMCPKSKKYTPYYPTITDTIVLRLLTIIVKKYCNYTVYHGLPQLKEQILKQCIRDSKDKKIRKEVQKLF